MADGNVQFKLGEHEQAIVTLLKNDEVIMASLKSIETTLAERRGSDRARTALFGAAGGVGAVIVGAATKLMIAFVSSKHP